MRKFVTWRNMFWLAWALWTFASQLSARPFHGVEDWLSTLAFSAFMGLLLAAMTLLFAGIALFTWVMVFLPFDEL